MTIQFGVYYAVPSSLVSSRITSDDISHLHPRKFNSLPLRRDYYCKKKRKVVFQLYKCIIQMYLYHFYGAMLCFFFREGNPSYTTKTRVAFHMATATRPQGWRVASIPTKWLRMVLRYRQLPWVHMGLLGEKPKTKRWRVEFPGIPFFYKAGIPRRPPKN